MKKIKETITKPVVLSVIFGLSSALVGTIMMISFFMPGSIFLKNFGTEEQTQEFLKTSLGIKAYGRLEVFKFIDESLPSVASIYKTKSSAGKSLVDSLYIEKERLGQGFILTSDGWIVTDQNVISGLAAQNISIAIKNKVYQAKTIVNDSWTDAAFVKIEASELPVVTLGDSSSLALGDIVFTGTNKNNFWFSYVTGANYYPPRSSKNDLILSSEEYGKIIKLQDAVPSELAGGMISDRDGGIVGMVISGGGGNYVLPSNYFKGLVSEVLKNKKITRPYLGVNYIDLGYAVGANLPNEKGAYIYGGGLLKSVETGSPAAGAGLKTGDIILSVEEDEAGADKNLAELITDYKSGDQIILNVLRDSKEQEIKAKLSGK